MKRNPEQLVAFSRSLIVLADDKTLWKLKNGRWYPLPHLPRLKREGRALELRQEFAVTD